MQYSCLLAGGLSVSKHTAEESGEDVGRAAGPSSNRPSNKSWQAGFCSCFVFFLNRRTQHLYHLLASSFTLLFISLISKKTSSYLRLSRIAVIWILVYPKTFPVGFKKHNIPEFLHKDCKNGKGVQTFSSSTADLCSAKNIIDYDPSCSAMSQQATDFRTDPEYRSHTQKLYHVWAKYFLCGPGK